MSSVQPDRRSRRSLLASASAGVAGAVLLVRPALAADDGEVTPTEDLMREHGLLDRILLAYEEIGRRISAGIAGITGPTAQLLAECASIVSKFVEDYHEKIEEEEVFPRLEKAGKLTDLTKTLRAQHLAGRAITARIAAAAKLGELGPKANGPAAETAINAFIRLYRPHAAREDTILFPAFHGSMKEKEFRELGERFEEREHKLLGQQGFQGGFEGVLEHVAQIERALGIYDLDQFTTAKLGR
jgi:hemerythrin-like domain-containing protein